MVEIINRVLPWTGSELAEFAWYRSQPLPSFGDKTAEEKEVIKKCILYLRQMADGELSPAQTTIAWLKKHNKKTALRILA